MVVQGIIALALALPTGMLFGLGYGTGVRIGYEQVYPLLFPKDSENRNVTPTVENIKNINKIYDTIGGKEASQMGIANGLAGAMSELNNNPDFQDLVELESKLSGRTPSNLDPHNQSEQTSTSDSESDSSLSDFKDSSGNFSTVAENPALYIHILKAQGDNAQSETNFTERKAKLETLLSKLSEKETKEAYSDMLSGRLEPSWAQEDSQFKQILTKNFKKTLEGPQILKEAHPIVTDIESKANLDYFQQKTLYMQASLTAKSKLAEMQNYINKNNLQNNRSFILTLAGLQAKYKAQNTILLKYISNARNKLSTKAQANNDWNKRIWKTV